MFTMALAMMVDIDATSDAMAPQFISRAAGLLGGLVLLTILAWLHRRVPLRTVLAGAKDQPVQTLRVSSCARRCSPAAQSVFGPVAGPLAVVLLCGTGIVMLLRRMTGQ
jgi:hypothetical protein